MNITTLKGVFPEPKPQPKRNFIKENMRHIKYLQGVLQPDLPVAPQKLSKSQTQPKTINKLTSSRNKLRDTASQDSQKISKPSQQKGSNKRSTGVEVKPRLEIRQLRDFGEITKKEDVANCLFNEKDKITHRGIQTERNDDMNKIYDCGVIKYPSPGLVQDLITGKKKEKRNDHGDSVERSSIEDKTSSIGDKFNYIKQNINAIKNKGNKSDTTSTTGSLPPNYQKGSVPKYLKDRKEEQLKEGPVDAECPPGHVLLPEDERKETLRVLRQSYADRISELNSMPVRNDTLKMRKRKVELEEELKKIDEGIKVFQRPKVYVKVNA
ncbi:uncharacterized protein [Onthophagus taurus]|uniref:uncharacterized protein n=1 Tax=Onthophagus taurus TaxID=166361 RepID=UPI000C20E861|nr:uncharacterized protein LOC111426144 [Onthophagus taurus]